MVYGLDLLYTGISSVFNIFSCPGHVPNSLSHSSQQNISHIIRQPKQTDICYGIISRWHEQRMKLIASQRDGKQTHTVLTNTDLSCAVSGQISLSSQNIFTKMKRVLEHDTTFTCILKCVSLCEQHSKIFKIYTKHTHILVKVKYKLHWTLLMFILL